MHNEIDSGQVLINGVSNIEASSIFSPLRRSIFVRAYLGDEGNESHRQIIEATIFQQLSAKGLSPQAST